MFQTPNRRYEPCQVHHVSAALPFNKVISNPQQKLARCTIQVHLWFQTFSRKYLPSVPFGCISGSIPLAAQTCQVHHCRCISGSTFLTTQICQVHHSGASLAPHPSPRKYSQVHHSGASLVRVHLWLHTFTRTLLPAGPKRFRHVLITTFPISGRRHRP